MSKEVLYKNTNLPWCPQIPSDWELKKFNRIAFYQEGPGLRNWQFTNEGIKVICVTNITENGIDFSKLTRNISVEEYNKIYKHFTVKKGDYLLASSGASWGKVAEYKDDETVILNTSTIRLNTLNEKELSRGFLQWIIKSSYISENLNILLTGSCQPNFGPTHLSQLYVAVPKDIKEQEKISAYLNSKTTEIENLIAAKEKLIISLKEERMAIINHAISKGINDNIKYKHSQVYWLDDIPSHWTIKKLKYVALVQPSNVDKKSDDKETPIRLCNYVDVYKNEFITEDIEFMEATAKDEEIQKFKLKIGDILITKDSEIPTDIAVPAYVKIENDDLVCGYHLAQIRANEEEVLGEYIFRVFQSKNFNSNFEIAANGITRYGLSIDAIKSVLIPIPPIDEQREIVQFILSETSKIDVLIKRIAQETELIKEYRTSLINEVVTGKISLN